MRLCLIAGGIACAILSPVFMQAQAPSGDSEAPPKPMNVLPKSERQPLPAAHRPVFLPIGMDLKGSVGYTYTSLSASPTTRSNLTGVNAALILESPFFGYTLDSSYVRGGNVLSTTNDATVLSYLGGVILYPVAHHKLRVYVRGLAGGAKVTGPIPTSDGTETGFVNKFSWAIGGGVEYRISHSWTFRSGADYQHTYFYDSITTIRGQNNFRAVFSLVCVLHWYSNRGY
jgi:opacity protein-like surface antigen